MKTLRKTIYLSFVCLAMVFASCSSDDDNNDGDGGNGGNGGNGTSTGTLTATVDGASFTSDPAFTQIQILNGVLAITGPKAQETIQFNVTSFDGTGTYAVSPTTVASYGITNDPNDPINSTVVYIAISDGQLEITEDTGSNMKGTFSFVGVNVEDPSDTVNVTNGAFDIS